MYWCEGSSSRYKWEWGNGFDSANAAAAGTNGNGGNGFNGAHGAAARTHGIAGNGFHGANRAAAGTNGNVGNEFNGANGAATGTNGNGQVSIVVLSGNGMNGASGVSYGIVTHGINDATDSVSFTNGIGNGGNGVDVGTS